jgi:hypothetical protein
VGFGWLSVGAIAHDVQHKARVAMAERAPARGLLSYCAFEVVDLDGGQRGESGHFCCVGYQHVDRCGVELIEILGLPVGVDTSGRRGIEHWDLSMGPGHSRRDHREERHIRRVIETSRMRFGLAEMARSTTSWLDLFRAGSA